MSEAHFGSDAVDRRPPGARGWLVLLVSLALAGLLAITALWRFEEGTGLWGLDGAVGWAAETATLVFWLGLGLAGALIAAGPPPLAGAELRAARRTSGPVALAALAVAAIVALLQLGRPAVAYWLLPLPNQTGRWPHFASPIAWATVAVVATAALVLAPARREPAGGRRRLAAATAGTALAALALVATSTVPAALGAVSLALFVAASVGAALLSALAGALVALAALRPALAPGTPPEREATERLAAWVPVLGLAVGGIWLAELVLATGARGRALGPSAWAFWAAVAGGVAAPQLLRLDRVRSERRLLLSTAVAVAAAAWLDRLSRLTGGLERSALPATWSRWAPTFWDAALLAGTAGLFVVFYALGERRLATGRDTAERISTVTAGEPVA